MRLTPRLAKKSRNAYSYPPDAVVEKPDAWLVEEPDPVVVEEEVCKVMPLVLLRLIAAYLPPQPRRTVNSLGKTAIAQPTHLFLYQSKWVIYVDCKRVVVTDLKKECSFYVHETAAKFGCGDFFAANLVKDELFLMGTDTLLSNRIHGSVCNLDRSGQITQHLDFLLPEETFFQGTLGVTRDMIVAGVTGIGNDSVHMFPFRGNGQAAKTLESHPTFRIEKINRLRKLVTSDTEIVIHHMDVDASNFDWDMRERFVVWSWHYYRQRFFLKAVLRTYDGPWENVMIAGDWFAWTPRGIWIVNPDSQKITCCIEAQNIRLLTCCGHQLLLVMKDDVLVVIE